MIHTRIKQVLGLALPMAWSRFIQMISWFLGMMMLSHLGKDVLAASALINAIQIAICISFMSMLFSTAVVAARLHGAGANNEIGQLLQQGLLLGSLLAVAMMLALYSVGPLLLWCGQAPELVKIVSEYFHVFAWNALPLMMMIMLQQLCYGIGQQRLVIYNNILSLIVFLPACYGFIYGGLGLTPCGVRGLAYGLILQCIVNTGGLLWCLAKQDIFKRYHFFIWHNHRNLDYIKQIYQIGWPMSVQFGGELLAFLVIMLLTGWLGPAALSATQIAQQVVLLFLVPLFAIAESAGIFVSQAIGAKQFDEVSIMGNACVILCIVVVSVVSLFFFIIPDQFTSMYIDIHNPLNHETVMSARYLFYLSAPMLLVDTLRNVYAGALRGFYDTRVPMCIGLISIWLMMLPCSFIFAFWCGWNVIGLRVGAVLGFAVGAGILCRRWIRKSTTCRSAGKSRPVPICRKP